MTETIFYGCTYIWRQEMRQVVKDEGVLMFLVIVPLGYLLLYSWIYDNETLHETPVVVADQSHSGLSRQFIHDCDATADVDVRYYAEDLDEARSLVSRQLVKGIYLIPFDFSGCVMRGEQGTVSVYCDMSLMLAYKAVYQTVVLEAGRLGVGLKCIVRYCENVMLLMVFVSQPLLFLTSVSWPQSCIPSYFSGFRLESTSASPVSSIVTNSDWQKSTLNKSNL